jgi:hypothetical protein
MENAEKEVNLLRLKKMTMIPTTTKISREKEVTRIQLVDKKMELPIIFLVLNPNLTPAPPPGGVIEWGGGGWGGGGIIGVVKGL